MELCVWRSSASILTGADLSEKGFPREILKLVERHDGETYRAAFAVTFEECVYLLHVFQKKSASGKATPRPDLRTILARWKAAQEDYRRRYGKD